AGGVNGARERHRHLRVRPDAEALADHQPRAEAAAAEEVLAAAADPVARYQADDRDDDEVDDEDEPVERGDCHGVTRRTRSVHASASQSAVTVPAVVVPSSAAGIVDAIGATSSIDRPVKRAVLAMARSKVTLDPARYGVPGKATRPVSSSVQRTPP